MAFTETSIPSVQGSQVLKTPPIFAGANQQNIFIYGHRNSTADVNGLPILMPEAGFPRYEYYKTYPLPANLVSDAPSMLSYFKRCGFNVGYGYVATISLLNASAVDITTFAATQIVRVYYLSSSHLIAPMVGSGITGTFSDTTPVTPITGVFIKAAIGSFTFNSIVYDSYVDLQSSDFATIAANNNISITFNEPILVPNPLITDEFLLNVYSACQATLIPTNVNSTVTAPAIYFSVLPDSANSAYFGPATVPKTLTVPTEATADTISFAIPSLNVSLVPLSELGVTTITQAVSLATGVVESATINGGTLVVTLSNIVGTFDTTNVCTLSLDSSQTVLFNQKDYFAKRGISLRYITCIYEITQASDITTLYADIFNHVAVLNLPASSQDGQGICHVAFGNKTLSKALAPLNLPTNVNNWQYVPIFYNYNSLQIGDIPFTIGQLVSASIAVVGSNVSPNNPQAGVIANGVPVLQNDHKWLGDQIGSASQIIQDLGWNAIAVNNNQQAYFINPITGLTTIPGTSVPNETFSPIYFWDTINQIRLGTIAILKSMGLKNERQTQLVYNSVKTKLISFLMDLELTNQVMNVIENESLLIVKEDSTNSFTVDVIIPTQIVPGLQNVNYTINVFSATVNL